MLLWLIKHELFNEIISKPLKIVRFNFKELGTSMIEYKPTELKSYFIHSTYPEYHL